MNAIISKYKGKAVLVDFWATWCGPCMSGMPKMKEYLNKYSGRLNILGIAQEIAFVYITNSSSPQKLWEEKIKIIGGGITTSQKRNGHMYWIVLVLLEYRVICFMIKMV